MLKIKQDMKEKTRYFLIAVASLTGNINSFVLETDEGFPTHKKCLTLANENVPNFKGHLVISVTEMSKEDMEKFSSEL
jgi:hypothetical protein